MANRFEGQSVTELGDPSCPKGDAGEEMLRRMNDSHYPVTGWALDILDVRPESRVLDIGCGGGRTLMRMAEKATEGKLTGVDYSDVSVALSREMNSEAVSSGRMEIVKASVSSLPFEDNSFDRIITVESFYFWSDPQNDLKEVFRVLDKGGRFLITADIHGGAELSTEEKASVEKYHLFNPTPGQFRELLTNAGFTDVQIHTKENTHWICAEGRK